MWVSDPGLRIIYWNDSATDLFGWTADEVMGRHTGELFRTLVPNSTRETAVSQVLQKGDFFGEVVCHCKDGSPIFVEAHSHAVHGPDGKVIRLVNTVRDITERKRAEKALKESEKKYRNLFNSIDEGYCIIEVLFDDNVHPIDYRFLEVNQALERQTGLPDAIGRRMKDMAPGHEQHCMTITYWNESAEKITGWPVSEAIGQSGKKIFEHLGVDRLWGEMNPLEVIYNFKSQKPILFGYSLNPLIMPKVNKSVDFALFGVNDVINCHYFAKNLKNFLKYCKI